jgi:hypothetical protein
VKPIEAAKDFILRYFADRTKEMERELVARRPFHSKYYAEKCLWDSRRLAVELSKSEEIVSIEERDCHAVAVTCRSEHSPKLRYTLEYADGGWLIVSVTLECAICHGVADSLDCEICSGSGWLPLPKE